MSDELDYITPPAHLTLPGPVTRVVVEGDRPLMCAFSSSSTRIMVRLADGSWVGRGLYLASVFTKTVGVVPAASIGFLRQAVRDWVPVLASVAARLEKTVDGPAAMTFPGPIVGIAE